MSENLDPAHLRTVAVIAIVLGAAALTTTAFSQSWTFDEHTHLGWSRQCFPSEELGHSGAVS